MADDSSPTDNAPEQILIVEDDSDLSGVLAEYLKRHGWYPGISRKEAQKVIYHYNHSDRYVDTILKISDLLKGSA